MVTTLKAPLKRFKRMLTRSKLVRMYLDNRRRPYVEHWGRLYDEDVIFDRHGESHPLNEKQRRQFWATMRIYEAMNQFISVEDVVLDIGCGAGAGTSRLNGRKVIGVDASEHAIEFAIRRYANERCHFQVMDARELEFPDNHFDVVVSFGCLYYLKGRNFSEAVAEAHRVSRDGGTFISAYVNFEQVPVEGADAKCYDEIEKVYNEVFGEFVLIENSYLPATARGYAMFLQRVQNQKVGLILDDSWLEEFEGEGFPPIFFLDEQNDLADRADNEYVSAFFQANKKRQFFRQSCDHNLSGLTTAHDFIVIAKK